MKVFALETSRRLGERVARHCAVPLAAHEERDFEDGEFKVRTLEQVQGETVFVVHSLHTDAHRSVNDKLCRLLFFIGSLKDAGAAGVVAVVPYLAFARKDRRTKSRDPVTTRYVAALFEAVGTDGVVTLDVHNLAAFENAFRCRKWHLTAAPLFIEHFRVPAHGYERVVVLSPDAGGVKRARAFKEALEAALQRPVGLGFMEKQRSAGQVTGDAFAGDVDGAFVVVVDDLISGGTTMARAARACRERGAVEVHAAATHGVFAKAAGEALGADELESVVVTDTISDTRRRCPAIADKLEVLDSSGLFKDVVCGV